MTAIQIQFTQIQPPMFLLAYLPTYIHTYIHTHIHTYIHTCIIAYIHTGIAMGAKPLSDDNIDSNTDTIHTNTTANVLDVHNNNNNNSKLADVSAVTIAISNNLDQTNNNSNNNDVNNDNDKENINNDNENNNNNESQDMKIINPELDASAITISNTKKNTSHIINVIPITKPYRIKNVSTYNI